MSSHSRDTRAANAVNATYATSAGITTCHGNLLHVTNATFSTYVACVKHLYVQLGPGCFIMEVFGTNQ